MEKRWRLVAELSEEAAFIDGRVRECVWVTEKNKMNSNSSSETVGRVQLKKDRNKQRRVESIAYPLLSHK